MRNRRFHPPKYRSKVQKMGVLYTHSPKRPGPFPKLSKKKNQNFFKKRGHILIGPCPTVARFSWPASLSRSISGRSPLLGGCPKLPLAKKNSSSCPHIFPHVVNSCWLALVHACPTQTSPKIFKHS